MTRLMRLLLILVIASLVLTACGAPAIQYEADHGEYGHDDDHAEDDHAEDDHAEDEGDHADEAAAEDDHAEDEGDHTDEAAAEDDHAEDEGDHADEAAAEEDAAEEPADEADAEESDAADEEAADEADDADMSGESAEIRIGDAASGEEIFNRMYDEVGFACVTCHRPDSEDQLIGPGLLNIVSRAATRVDGQSAEAYLYESIVNPDAYVVENFSDALMPEVYTDLLSEDEIADVMGYLLTLEG
jgi:cytochrome c2